MLSNQADKLQTWLPEARTWFGYLHRLDWGGWTESPHLHIRYKIRWQERMDHHLIQIKDDRTADTQEVTHRRHSKRSSDPQKLHERRDTPPKRQCERRSNSLHETTRSNKVRAPHPLSNVPETTALAPLGPEIVRPCSVVSHRSPLPRISTLQLPAQTRRIWASKKTQARS